MTTSVNISLDPKVDKEMRLTLEWNNERSIIDRIFNRPRAVLALGCYYVTDFGGKSLIDRLQFRKNHGGRDRMTRQGSYDMVPYIWHEGTERADSGQCIESVIINTAKIQKLKRISVYTFVMAGKPRWNRIRPKLTVDVPGQEVITYEFNTKHDKKKRVYAIIDIEVKGNDLTIKPMFTLHGGHRDCNDTYDWGLNVAP